MSKSINVSDDTHGILMYIKGRIMMDNGEIISIANIIHYLVVSNAPIEDIINMIKDKLDK